MEADFVEWLRGRVGVRPELPLALGDDASLYLDRANERLVMTTDLLCEGSHFLLEETSYALVGRKAMAVNLSDMAAMASRPRVALVSVAWPRRRDERYARELYDGLLDLANAYGVTLAGGDTNRWDGGLVVNVTLLGHAHPRGVLRRDGARPGDRILVTGSLGGSLLGHHLRFEPRVELAAALKLAYDLRSGMDISDGLSLDLSRLVTASGVAAELDLAQVPISEAARTMSRTSGRAPLDHALADGEDFELLLTAPPEDAARIVGERHQGIPVTDIGVITEGAGVWQREADGSRRPLPVKGYLH
jgi:thiamine-monophosphate kinase